MTCLSPKHTIKTAVFDLETTDLQAVGPGFVLGGVILPFDGEPRVYRIDTYHAPVGNDTELVRALVNALLGYDVLISHNGERFDWNFLRSRLVVNGLALPTQLPFHYDTCLAFRRVGLLTAQNGFGKPRASLDFACDFFGLPQLKTKVGYPRQHWQIVFGAHPRERRVALDNLMDHCRRDVQMTLGLYRQLIKLDSRATLRKLKS